MQDASDRDRVLRLFIMGDSVRIKEAFNAASDFLNPVLQRGTQISTLNYYYGANLT